MMMKRPKQLLIGGAIIAAIALGGSLAAGAASATAAPLTAAPLASPSTNRAVSPALSLTDHERYVLHHQRLASAARER